MIFPSVLALVGVASATYSSYIAGMVCPDGSQVPAINLQLIHLHDMGAGQKILEVRSEVPNMIAGLESTFGETTQTALATFVDKPYAQHTIENTWCYKKEFGFGVVPNSAAFTTSMSQYSTFMGQDYNMGDSQLDPIFIALRRANEFAWNFDEFGANGLVNLRIFSLATNQHPLNSGNYTENSVLPNWSDDAHEQCETVNYPSVEQMKMSVQNLKSYFIFMVDSGDSGYGDLVLNYYSSIPNSVTVDLNPNARSATGDLLLAAIKKLLCDVVEWPETCSVPDELVPHPNCECSCKLMSEIHAKFDAHCW